MAYAAVETARVRRSRWAPAAVLAGGAALACTAAVLVGLLIGSGNPSSYLLVDAVQGLAYPAVGAGGRPAAAQRRRLAAHRHRGRARRRRAGRGARPARDLGCPVAESWLWFPGLALLTAVLPILVPDGRPPGRWGRRLLTAAVTVVVAATAVVAVLPRIDGSRRGELVANPVGIAGADAAVGPVFVLWMADSVLALGSLVRRWRRADGDGRRALLPVLAAVTVIAAALIAVKVVQSVRGGEAAEPLVQALVLPLVPLSVAVSVLRYRLFDLEVALRRSAVYAVLAILLGAAYAAVVVGTSRLLHDRFPTLPVTAATITVALGFAPLRSVVQRGVSRVLFGERDDPYAVLSGLGHRLAAAPRPGGALDGVTALICGTLRVPAAALVGRDGAVVAATGVPAADALRLPVVVDGDPEGELVVSPRVPGDVFGTRDRELLADLARSAGPALRSDRLAAELRRSRERLVRPRGGAPPAAPRPARRPRARARRPGAQLDAARDPLPATDPDAAGPCSPRAAATSEGDRRHPPGGGRPAPARARRLGLLGALREARRALRGRPAAAGHRRRRRLPPLPAAVEVAAYRIVQEAVDQRRPARRRRSLPRRRRDRRAPSCACA